MKVLSAMIALPTIVGLIVFALRDASARVVAILGAAGTLALSLYACSTVQGSPGYALTESYEWLPSLGISFSLGIDGISGPLVVLTALLTLVSMLCSASSLRDRAPSFYALLLLLETGCLGVFLSLDIFFFYVFWELTLIPMIFLIGIWGGPRRVPAAVKFVLFTVVGSLFMLAAILYVGLAAQTFSLIEIPRQLEAAGVSTDALRLAFLGFLLGFAIKTPLFPLHTWLPDAHTEAPTAGSVILAGVLLKLGTYGLVRYAIPLFPEAARHFSGPILAISVIGIIYGAWMCLVQGDIKRLIAYSSVSHMGLVVFGLFTFSHDAVQGAVMQMIGHGLSTGGLFLLVGMLYDRAHRRGVEDFGGLAEVTPRYATLFFLTTLSSIGVPGLNGFVGEFLVILGAFPRAPLATAAAATGVILGALYMLTLYRQMFWGEVRREDDRKLTEPTAWETAGMFPLVGLMVLLGVVPRLVLDLSGPVTQTVLRAFPGAP